MRISRLPKAGRPAPLAFPLADVPHLTLEPTRRCNLACELCYALEKQTVKTLASIREELDLACRRRRLHAVTLVGGEPTLHDGIVDIVREVKRRGLVCQLLTNGLKFLPRRGRSFLRELVAAGLDKIAFHVDGGQGHRDVEAVRQRLFGLCEDEHVLFSLSLTVYPEAEAEIPVLLRRYAAYRYFDGILAVLGREPERNEPHGPSLDDQYAHIAAGLGITPVSYVPSSRDPEEAFWLVYSYFIRADTGRTFGLSPFVHRLERTAGRLLAGRHRFVPLFRPRRTPARFLVLGALDALLAPRKLPSYLAMIRGRGALASLRGHYIAIQRPPETDPDTGDLVLCYHCPDATVRDGRITPVCLADFVRPFDGRGPREALHERWRSVVDAHLGGG
ncbi:MAG: radical SAM protein [Gemmatimonadota bacterium]|jgi:hypothetical protein